MTKSPTATADQIDQELSKLDQAEKATAESY